MANGVMAGRRDRADFNLFGTYWYLTGAEL